ncbi:hypothetical protein BH10ACI2_BH10ACI2_00090 [soil metagenome]
MIKTIRERILYFLGFVVGLFLGSSVKTSASAEEPVARRHNRPAAPKPFVDPRILIAKDIYGMCHHRSRRPDSVDIKADELLLGMAEYAAHFAKAHADETGELMPVVRTYRLFWSGNRAIPVEIAWSVSRGEEKGLLKLDLSDKEKSRARDLGRMMKRFSN